MSDVDKTKRAPYDSNMDWNAINWREVRKKVRRLQTRIAKAIQKFVTGLFGASLQGLTFVGA